MCQHTHAVWSAELASVNAFSTLIVSSSRNEDRDSYASQEDEMKLIFVKNKCSLLPPLPSKYPDFGCFWLAIKWVDLGWLIKLLQFLNFVKAVLFKDPSVLS